MKGASLFVALVTVMTGVEAACKNERHCKEDACLKGEFEFCLISIPF